MRSRPTQLPEAVQLAWQLADCADAAVFVCDERQQLAFASRACRELLGIATEFTELAQLRDRVVEADRARFATVLASKQPEQRIRIRFATDDPLMWQTLELRIRLAAGWMIVRLVPTELRASDSSSRLEAIARAAADVITEIDERGTTLWSRRNSEHLLTEVPAGASLDESLDCVHPDDQKRAAQEVVAAWSGDEPLCSEFRVLDRDGAWRWVQATVIPRRNADGERRLMTLTRDVTESRKLLDQLSASEERYRLLAVNGHDMISEHDSDGRLLYANPLALASTGYRLEDLDGVHPLDSIHPDDLQRVARMYDRVFRTGERVSDTYRCRNRDGSWSWLESSAHMHRSADGSDRVVTLTRDVTARMRAEKALQESEERYRQLVEQSPEAIGVVFEGDEGIIAYTNQAGARLMGVEDPRQLIGRTLLDFLSPSTLRGAVVEDANADQAVLEMEIRRPDGALRQLVVTGKTIVYDGRRAVQGMARDVTDQRASERERERLRAQLEESRKLESLGVLAGGIAHDFNNLLTVVLANGRFVQREGNANSEAKHALEDALDAAERAARLTRQLLAYAGRREPEVRAIDVSEHARSVSHILRSAVPRSVSLELELDDELPFVHADVVQLEQVIMNLVLNGVDAIGDGPGTLRVATFAIDVDRARIATWTASEGLETGTYVCLEVSDTGCGMDADTRGRIFDPFFTTKAHGHGLGLSAVLGLVRGHDGGVSIESRPGEGTTIRVFLPRS